MSVTHLLQTTGVSISISQLLDRYVDGKNSEFLYSTGYIRNTLMRVQARKNNGCRSDGCPSEESF